MIYLILWTFLCFVFVILAIAMKHMEVLSYSIISMLLIYQNHFFKPVQGQSIRYFCIERVKIDFELSRSILKSVSVFTNKNNTSRKTL